MAGRISKYMLVLLTSTTMSQLIYVLTPSHWPLLIRTTCGLLPLFIVIHLLMHVPLSSARSGVAIVQSILLLGIWCALLYLLFYPIFWTLQLITFIHLPAAFLVAMYLPILFIFAQDQQFTNKSRMYLLFLGWTWDTPLILWLYTCHSLGIRALEPFFSHITDQLSIGSMPLPGDSLILRKQRVGLVINMCREFTGLPREYVSQGIEQVHLPTPDICAPTFDAVMDGVDRMWKYLQEYPKGRVFVHCKGGRSRSAIMLLCFMIAQEASKVAGKVQSRSELEAIAISSMQLLSSKREVVESSSLRFKVVKRFIDELLMYGGDFSLLYQEHSYQRSAKQSLKLAKMMFLCCIPRCDNLLNNIVVLRSTIAIEILKKFSKI